MYKDEADAAMVKFKEENPNYMHKSTRKKKKKKQGDEAAAEELLESSPMKVKEVPADEDMDAVAVVVADDGKDSGEEEENEEDNGKKDTPKRPLNAYMLFSKEVRSKITEDNPDAKPKDIESMKVVCLLDLFTFFYAHK